MLRYLLILSFLPAIYIQAANAQNLVITDQIATDPLDVTGTGNVLPYVGGVPSYWVLEREISTKDAIAVSLAFGMPKGTKAWVEVVALSASSRPSAKPNSKDKKRKPDKKNKRSNANKPSWYLDFLNTNGKIAPVIEIKAEDQLQQSGLAYLLADACNTNGRYLLRLVFDFRSVDIADPASIQSFQTLSPAVQVVLSNAPQSQATLFKYPSEKDPGSAVVLMQTSGVSPEYITFTGTKGGVPFHMDSFLVDQYFFSGSGLFTRLYLQGSFLSGGYVSMHHLSSDKTAIYSVCVSLSRKRQELEGYH